MLTLDQIINAITASRSEFASAFMRAQAAIIKDLDKRVEFEAVAAAENDYKKAFRKGLEYAKAAVPPFYDELLVVICNNHYEDGSISIDLVKKKNGSKKVKGNSYAEAISRVASGYYKKDIVSKLTDGFKWTGKVMINDEPKGSGVLIGPKRFLTAWHVVKELFEIDKTSMPFSYTPKKERVPVEIIFEHQVSTKEEDPLKVKVAENWIEVFSNSHVDEFVELPDPLTQLKGFWDYAILYLEDAVSDERHWAIMDARAVVPDKDADIFVFQYPNGKDLSISFDRITSPEQKDEAIPAVRFLHHSNSDHGSSGGPCFDKEFYLIGIHQGKWPIDINGAITNRGIPISSIVYDMKEKEKAVAETKTSILGKVPEEYIRCYLTKENFEPVIGIDDFQFLILDTSKADKSNLFLIEGDQGFGKSFCIQTLSVLLPDTGHLKILLSAEAISKMTIRELVDEIGSKIGSKIELADPKKYKSTIAAWLRGEVIHRVINAIDDKRTGRIAWFCITDLEVYDIVEDIRDFLLLLYESLADNSWLQLVFDGAKKILPASVTATALEYVVKEKNREDMHKYVKRALAELGYTFNEDMADAIADTFMIQYETYFAADKPTALKLFAIYCGIYWKRFAQRTKKQKDG